MCNEVGQKDVESLPLPKDRLLQLGQRGPFRFARWSAYLVFCEVTKRPECLTDRQPFESILLDWGQVLPVGEAKFDARQIALRLQFSREFIALLAGNRLALLPRFVRARPLVGRNVSVLRTWTLCFLVPSTPP